MDCIQEVFEVLNLDEILSDEEIDFNFPPLLPSKGEEDEEEHSEGVQEPDLDPYLFITSTIYYSFKRELGIYLIKCLKGESIPLADTIIAIDPNFLSKEGTTLEASHKAIFKKWGQYMRTFEVRMTTDGEELLGNKKFPTLNIPYIDEWVSIVVNAHCGKQCHQAYKSTHSTIVEQGWLIGAQINGIPRPFIEEFIKRCEGCEFGQQRGVRRMVPITEPRQYRQYTSHYTMPRSEEEEFMNNLKAEHAVCLKFLHKYTKVSPYASKVVIYVCHRGRKPRNTINDTNGTTDRLRQHSTAKYVGCKFYVKIIYPEEEGRDIQIHVNAEPNGHEPRSRKDCYFLPVHQSAINNCAEMLSNLINIQFALAYSTKCENILREKTPLHEQKIFRFFLDPNEASNLSYRLQREGKCSDDDYEVVKQTIPKWIEKKKVIFYQPYSPNNPEPDKRPFVLVMQTEEMLERAKNITPNCLAWVIDSTFKTNQWGMPLFSGMCPNANGLGMPVFMMLCSDDKEQGHVGTALWLTMKAVFLNMETIRPNAIVIDKDKTSRIAITKAIHEDVWCWEKQEIGGTQIACRLLLCWFHAKKAWVDHLLPKLPEVMRGDLYKAMSSMLEASSLDKFQEVYENFKVKYANNPNILKYVEKGWAGDDSPWRCMWPRWSRMFPHGNANTTNLVERMWQYAKYTLLDEKVNRRLDELIFALIGNPDTGRRFGGLTLVEHYDKAHWLSESGKYSKRGGDKHRTLKLQKAKALVQRYKSDPSSYLEIIDECHLEFAFRSQTDDNKWYIVSLSREWCECDDYGPICKHMWVVKTIVREEFPHLLDLIPSAYEPEGFIRHFEEQTRDDEPLIVTPDTTNGQTSEVRTEEIDGVQRDLLKEMVLGIENMGLAEKLGALQGEQYEFLKNMGKSFLAILQSTMELELRPSRVSMPREGGSITSIQARVTNTRLEHGSHKKKRKLNDEEPHGGEQFIPKSPRPGGMREVRRSEIVQKKRTRVKLPKLCKEECPECGGLNIFFDGVTDIECHNCQEAIVKRSHSIALNKEGCEVDQDVELFFKDLEIF